MELDRLTLIGPRKRVKPNLVSHLQRRGGSPGSTPCKEGEVDFHFEVVIPACGPFLFVVGIDDGLHSDPMLSDLIRFDLGSSKPLDHVKPPYPCGSFIQYHNKPAHGPCKAWLSFR